MLIDIIICFSVFFLVRKLENAWLCYKIKNSILSENIGAIPINLTTAKWFEDMDEMHILNYKNK